MQGRRHFDVGVIGAGPAGATAARWLAERGYRVALLHHSPRTASPDPIWETLSPGALELLRFSHPDLFPGLEQYLAPCSATVLWSRQDSESAPRHAATLIDRKKLDLFLRQSAIATGARLLPGARVVSRQGDLWAVATRNGDPIHCCFLVNAAGRHSAWRDGRVALGPRTIALTAHVTGSSLVEGESRVAAAAEGWLWAVRCGSARASVTLFVDLKTAHRWQRQGREEAFLECLRKTSLCRSRTGLQLRSRIRAGAATIAAQSRVFAGGVAHIGDAALAMDPLASQGIHHALLSAQQAAIAIHTTLARGHAALAGAFLGQRHEEALQQHLSACAVFYQRQDIFQTPFWKERANPANSPNSPGRPPRPIPAHLDSLLVISPRVRWKTVPVVAGDFIESRSALCHPRLSRPIAYLAHQAIGDLFTGLPPRFPAGWLVGEWIKKGIPREAASRALVFLVENGVLVARNRKSGRPAPSSEGVPPPLTVSPAQLAPLSRH